jgi:hypothetical protein
MKNKIQGKWEMKFITITAVFAAVFISTFVHAAEQSNEKQLIAYWNFDEGEGDKAADASGNGYNGKILNNMRAVKWVDGRKGKALEFSGTPTGNNSGAVSVPNFNIDFSKGISVELWMKLDAKADWEKGSLYILCTSPGNYGPGFIFYYNWKHIMFLSGNGDAKQYWDARASVTDLRNQWVHLAAVYDGNVCRIYINGALSGNTGSPVEYIGRKNLNLTIGSGWSGAGCGYQGILDEIKVYNYALSASEIINHAKLAL